MKPMMQSRTLWFNTLVVGIAAGIASVDPSMVPPNVWPWVLVAQAVVNAVLRVLTTKAVTL